VVVLDLETGEPLRAPVDAHDAVVESLTYSEDGAWLVSTAPNSTVALWDAETGLLTSRVVTHSGQAVSGFIEGHDTVLIAPVLDGPLVTGDTRIVHALGFACAIAGRDLTEDEWREAFGDRPDQSVC
jgi:WD40 repeat protein